MPRVAVVGSGPAGLAAAERLAEQGLDPILLTMGHHLGGKACSWELEDGRTVEHGQHVLMGFYQELPALLARAGVDSRETSVSGRGHFRIFEDRDWKTHHLYLGECAPGDLVRGITYSGWTGEEIAKFAAFFTSVAPSVLLGVPEAWDDLCLTAWALQRGFPISAASTNAFRSSREAQLNWPGEISAYTMLKTIRLAGRDYTSSEARFPAGGMSALWWDPLAAHIEGQGGSLRRYAKLIGIVHESGRLTGLRFGLPLPHDPSRPHQIEVPIQPGSEWVEEVDGAILTLPAPSLWEVMEPDLRRLPELRGVGRLKTAAPLGLHVWHRNAVTGGPRTVVCGLEPPLGYVVNNKWFYPRYQRDPSIGAALHFVGQETCFEEDDDETLLKRALRSVRRVPGFEGMDLDGVLDFKVVRNRAPHKRYWNAEPGSLRFKPWPKTPVSGLYLAGDWVRSDLDFPCMETAVRSGLEAAELLIHGLGSRKRRAS